MMKADIKPTDMGHVPTIPVLLPKAATGAPLATDLPRPLQEMLFDTADGLAPQAPPAPSPPTRCAPEEPAAVGS